MLVGLERGPRTWAGQIGTGSTRILEFAKGPYVVWANEAESKDQNGSPCKFNWFDMVRVDGGLIQEHWDSAKKTPPPASVPRPAGFREYR